MTFYWWPCKSVFNVWKLHIVQCMLLSCYSNVAFICSYKKYKISTSLIFIAPQNKLETLVLSHLSCFLNKGKSHSTICKHGNFNGHFFLLQAIPWLFCLFIISWLFVDHLVLAQIVIATLDLLWCYGLYISYGKPTTTMFLTMLSLSQFSFIIFRT